MAPPKETKISKIVRYQVEEMCYNLKLAGLSYSQIADELNASGKVPEHDPVNKYVVARFCEKVPEIAKESIKNNKKRLMKVVNNNLDVIFETNNLFQKTKNLLEEIEQDAEMKEKLIDPYRYKALSSEMRELLKLMIDIHKEINDYKNIKKFIEIIIQTVTEEAPDALPFIVAKLKACRESHWFGDIVSNIR
jgi:hypothetical protein